MILCDGIKSENLFTLGQVEIEGITPYGDMDRELKEMQISTAAMVGITLVEEKQDGLYRIDVYYRHEEILQGFRPAHINTVILTVRHSDGTICAKIYLSDQDAQSYRHISMLLNHTRKVWRKLARKL